MRVRLEPIQREVDTVNTTSFDRPVRLRLPSGDTLISDVQQADALLRTSWPPNRGKWYHAARRACSRSIQRPTEGRLVRDVFEKAAAEARLS